MPLIEDKIVSIAYGYATVNIDGKIARLHNLVVPPCPGETIDHINLNRSDNKRENLRSASRQTQALNQGKCSNNTSGYVGVSYNKQLKTWVASWSNRFGNSCSRKFSCKKYGEAAKDKAIAYHQHIEQSRPHYIEALVGRTRTTTTTTTTTTT